MKIIVNSTLPELPPATTSTVHDVTSDAISTATIRARRNRAFSKEFLSISAFASCSSRADTGIIVDAGCIHPASAGRCRRSAAAGSLRDGDSARLASDG